jgi:heme/copper-type cytochrome/quinol oxidase subunit 3
MFAKTLISTLSVLTIVVGLIVFIRSGEYAIFAIGMIAYFLVAISQNVCARYQGQSGSNS